MKKTKFLRKRTLTVLLILKVLLVSGYPSSSADSEQSEGENKEYFSQTNINCGHIMISSQDSLGHMTPIQVNHQFVDDICLQFFSSGAG